jgi:dienelactone hydrolase
MVTQNTAAEIVKVELGLVHLKGELVVPTAAGGIVIFAHSSGSNLYNTRNHYLAHLLRQQAGLATLLIDLLTTEEEAIDQRTKHFHCDIKFLASRLIAITDWLLTNPNTRHLNVGYFGDNWGGGAAFMAAIARPMTVKAIVCRSGQTDLASEALSCVQVPTLLIVGGDDYPVIAMNEDALAQIAAENKQLALIPGVTHQFAEPGALEEAARLASQWFKLHLQHSCEPERDESLILHY